MPHIHVHHEGDARPSTAGLGIALGLILAFMVAELVAGTVAHSLALYSDAAHMLTDVLALGLALAGARLATRPPAGGLTFGLRRIEILSALVNATMLLALAAFIAADAIRRLVRPGPVAGSTVIVVALAGVAVNLAATWQLARANHTSLNIRASYAHILTDLWAFIATAVAGAVIVTTRFRRADAIASLLIAALMLHASFHLLREAVRILLEGAPKGVRPGEVARSLAEHPCVTNVHDLHVWEITSGFPALSAHVLVRPGDDCHAIREDLERMLDERFAIGHTTLQVDHDQRGRLLTIQTKPPDQETVQ